MSIVVRKTFFAWQMDKEKKWLEAKAREGLILVKVRPFKYEFEQSDPMEVVYQFDFQFMSNKDKEEYLSMFKDWNLVENKVGGWYYFWKLREDSKKDELYNDNESKKQMYRRLIFFLMLVGFPLYYQILIFFPNMEEEIVYPSFYFFFRILVFIFLILYIYAIVNILLIYRSYKNRINQ